MMPILSPEFPIKVTFLEDSDVWVFDNEEEMACSMEWFDSDDPEEQAIVIDNQERPIRLKVQKLEIVCFELRNQNLG